MTSESQGAQQLSKPLLFSQSRPALEAGWAASANPSGPGAQNTNGSEGVSQHGQLLCTNKQASSSDPSTTHLSNPLNTRKVIT